MNKQQALSEFISSLSVDEFGYADLSDVDTPAGLPRACVFLRRMPADIMKSIKNGPTEEYAEEYRRANAEINTTGFMIEKFLFEKGYKAKMIHASVRTDKVNLMGIFPHKTAATRAGLGWIGKSCMLINKNFGPYIRIGTVLTDMPLKTAEPVVKSKCGKCRKCVEACPIKAICGNLWEPGMPRHDLFDAFACEMYKTRYFSDYNNGNNCGICASVCPFGK